MSSLHSFSRDLLTGPLNLPALLEKLIAHIQPIAGSAPVFVFLYDAVSGRFSLCQASNTPGAVQPDLHFDREGGLVHWLAEAQGPLYLLDPEAHLPTPELPADERHILVFTDTVLFLPLLSRGGRYGAEAGLSGWVALGPRPSGAPYRPDDVRQLAALTDQAALALETIHMETSVHEVEQTTAEFLDFVAHELKQPMTAIQGYARMLILGIGGELNDTQRQFAQVINSNSDRLGRLVNNLLEIARLEAGRIQLQPAPVNLKEVVAEVVAHTRPECEARHHTLVVEVPDDLPPVLGDRVRLIQVLGHLVNNACRYTPEGGTIRITANRPGWPALPPDQLLVSVSDTGIGMSPQQLAGLEEKFFRANHDLVRAQPGTGLGVSIARHLVALHGGKFLVESEPEQGSSFRFTLPIVDTGQE